MMATLQDARKLCSPVAMAGGACSSGAILDERINEATRRLSRMYDNTELLEYVHLLARGNTVTMPYGVKSARLINIGLNPTRLRHVGYEFSLSGPGQEAQCECGSLSIVAEPGYYPTFFDIPRGRCLSVAAFVAKPTPSPLEIRVSGRFENGEKLHDGTRDGLPLRVNLWDSQVEGEIDANSLQTLGPIADITQIVLPSRSQYLTLLGIDLETYETFFLGKYHPDDTNPGFRRYRIRGTTCEEEHCVSCLVKREAQELKYAEDVLPVQNLDALKQMVMGIREENVGNLQGAQVFFQMAQMALSAEMDDQQRGEEITLPMTDQYGYGGGSLNL